MKFIAHRINTISELQKLDDFMGAEIDVRDYGRSLILCHDPFRSEGENLQDFLSGYNRNAPLILNVKSEGIEFRIIELMKDFQIKSWFFLDSSFPVIHQLVRLGIQNFALRHSVWEGMENAEKMQGRAGWIWADYLGKSAMDKISFVRLKALGYKICIVSPGITGSPESVSGYAQQLAVSGIIPDAVCAKQHEFPYWEPLMINSGV